MGGLSMVKVHVDLVKEISCGGGEPGSRLQHLPKWLHEVNVAVRGSANV